MSSLSVHLQSFPDLKNIVVDADVVAKMDLVRDICNSALSLRKDANIRVRMPISKMTLCSGSTDLELARELSGEFLQMIKQEINVKDVEIFSGNIDEIANCEVVLNMRECGKIFGSNLKNILAAQKNGEWKIGENGNLIIAGAEVDKALFKVEYKPKDGSKAMQCALHNVLVMIDTKITHELLLEGLSRDVVRMVQQARKDNGLFISDRIETTIFSKDAIFSEVLAQWKDYIQEQTLSEKLELVSDFSEAEQEMMEIDGYKFGNKIKKI